LNILDRIYAYIPLNEAIVCARYNIVYTKAKSETAQRSALRNLFKINAGSSIKLCLLFLLLDLLCQMESKG
jgi:hypothetical protein